MRTHQWAVWPLCATSLLAGCRGDEPTGPRADAHTAVAMVAWSNGDYIRTPDGQAYLVFDDTLHPLPDAATLNACTGGYPAVTHATTLPALPLAAPLPSAEAHDWLGSVRPVKSLDHPAVWTVSGCVRSPIPDPETYYALFGRGGANPTVEVAGDVLDLLPRAGAARLPLRAAGTLIRTAASPEVRWVTHVGAARAIPSLDVLRSYCRTDVLEVSAEEFAAYPSLAPLAPASLGCASAEPPPGDGVLFEVAGESGTWLAFDGVRYRFPDALTLSTCTAGNEWLVRTFAQRPPLPSGPTLPSASAHGWLNGVRPIRRAGSPQTYALIGCVKSLIPHEETLPLLYGQEGLDDIRVVSGALLDALPTGPNVLYQLRPYGTLLRRGQDPEVRFLTYHGGALAVPAMEVLASHCRRHHVVTRDDAEFGHYRVHGGLAASSHGCSPSPDTPTGFIYYFSEWSARRPARFGVERSSANGNYMIGGPIGSGLPFPGMGNVNWPSASPDGSKVVFSGAEITSAVRFIFTENVATVGRQQLTSGGVFDAHPAWSHDGKRIAFSRSDYWDLTTARIWVMNADGSGQRQVGPLPERAEYPSWTPDDRIVYRIVRDGASDLARLDPDRADADRALLTNAPDINVGPPAVSPDGAIAYWEFAAGDSALRLRVVGIDGGIRTVFSRGGGGRVSWSPDGRFLAFQTGRHEGITLLHVETGWVMLLPGSRSEASWGR